MTESFLAVTTFWLMFAVTPGPFWTAVMRTASDFSVSHIYKQYHLYYLTGWLTINVSVGVIVYLFGQFSPALMAWMHIVGIAVLAWLSWKMFRVQHTNGQAFDFNWKVMSVLTMSNPKCWLLIPLGFLGANFSDHLVINIALFYVLGAPIFYGMLYFWIMIGKLGAQISLRGIRWFNLVLMILFALYLGTSGYQEIRALYL